MVYYRLKGENIMYAEIKTADQESLNKLILSAIESQNEIVNNLGFILEVIPDQGVYIIASSSETDMIPLRDLSLMLTACGTEILKAKNIRGSVQVHDKPRFFLQL